MTLAFKARSNDPQVASYRYRVLEPIRFLGARGHAVELYDEARFARYAAVVFCKAYGREDQALARRLRDAGKRVILDLCDDHFHNPRNLPKYRAARADLLAMIALADRVTCSTPVLARSVKLAAGLAQAPAVAPDAFEQAPVAAGPPTPLDRPARLLWFGRHGSPNAEAGMADLLLIRAALAEAYGKRPFELVVCSDSRPLFEQLFDPFPVPARYVDWTPDSFAIELARADGVLIPLSDNPFVAAKTHNRLTLALSAGVPVAADPLDSYLEFAPFCWIGDWAGGLEAMLLRPDEARARAAGARAYLEARWSPEAVAPLWEAVLGLDAAGSAQEAAEPAPGGDAAAWLAAEGRCDRPWLLAARSAAPEAVERARAEGFLVMSLGEAFTAFEADVAYVPDVETMAAHGEALLARARFLLAPSNPHQGGWASGRSLASWAADIPALARFEAEGRLLRFDLWTGSAGGLFGDPDGAEIPARLLAAASARTIRTLGSALPEPSVTGFEGLRPVGARGESIQPYD